MPSTYPKARSQTASPVAFAVGGAGTSVALTGYGTFKEDNQPGDLPDGCSSTCRSSPSRPCWSSRWWCAARCGTTTPNRWPAPRWCCHCSRSPRSRSSISGLTAVLAAGALCTALAARQRAGRWTAVPGVAVALSAAAVALAVVFAIIA